MTNVASTVVYLLVFLFNPGQIPDPDTLSTFTYDSIEECEESASTLRQMLTHNEEFVKRSVDAGYAGVMTLCTDDPSAAEL